MYVSNFQIKARQVVGLKFDTKFPFWISFIQDKVFAVTIHLGKFGGIYPIKCYIVVQVAQVFLSSIPAYHQALGFASSVFLLSDFLPF